MNAAGIFTIVVVEAVLVAGLMWWHGRAKRPAVSRKASTAAEEAAHEAFDAERQAERYELEAAKQRLVAQSMRARAQTLSDMDDSAPMEIEMNKELT